MYFVHRCSFGEGGAHSARCEENETAREATSLSDSSHGRSEIGVGSGVAKYAYVLNFTYFKDRSSSIRVKVVADPP